MDHFCPLQGWLGLNVGGLDFLQIAGLAAGQDSDGTKLFDVGRNFNESSFKRSEKSSGKVFQLAYIFLIIKRSVWEEQSLSKNINWLTVKWKLLTCKYYRQHQHKKLNDLKYATFGIYIFNIKSRVADPCHLCRIRIRLFF